MFGMNPQAWLMDHARSHAQLMRLAAVAATPAPTPAPAPALAGCLDPVCC